MSSDAKLQASARAMALREAIVQHDHAYYVLDAPTVSDAAYDDLMRELISLYRHVAHEY